MPIRVFDTDERERLREQMLEAGIPLLREYGMTHMSVEKITTAAGIGKSTFYNFFDSKEAYVCRVIEHKRGDFKAKIVELLAGREKLTVEEAKAMFRQIIFSEESAYQYLTPEDIVKIRAKVPEAVKPDLAQETAILSAIFNHVEGVRENPDFGVIANLLKLAALAAESRDQLHEAAYLRTQDSLFGLLFSLVFEDCISPMLRRDAFYHTNLCKEESP